MDIKLLSCGSTKWDRFIKNWGISFLIDNDVLFDTFGNPRIFMKNIKKFNVDVQKIKHIVISHEHWDHISGLWYILEKNKNVTIYICSHTDIKIKEKIKSFGAKLQEIDTIFKIKENIYSIGELSKDSLFFEQSLCIQSRKGLVVITGCAHPGIVDIIQKVKQQFGDKIYVVVGGFHLKNLSFKNIQNVINKLKQMDVEYFVPLHCTGNSALILFNKIYGDKCLNFSRLENMNI